MITSRRGLNKLQRLIRIGQPEEQLKQDEIEWPLIKRALEFITGRAILPGEVVRGRRMMIPDLNNEMRNG